MYSIQCAYVFKPLNPATLTEVIFIGPYGLLDYCVYIWNITLVFCGMCVFKPGARRPQAGVRLVSRNHFRAAKVCVCVSTPETINN